jgi:type III secretion apparatus needle protein
MTSNNPNIFAPPRDSSYIDTEIAKFDKSMEKFSTALDDAIDALGVGDSTNPTALAEYQKALMKFTLHVNAQSSFMKGTRDMDSTIIHNFN